MIFADGLWNLNENVSIEIWIFSYSDIMMLTQICKLNYEINTKDTLKVFLKTRYHGHDLWRTSKRFILQYMWMYLQCNWK